MITAMAPVAALVQVRCLAWALPCAADKAQKTSKAFLLIPFFSFLIFCAFKFYFAFFLATPQHMVFPGQGIRSEL